MCLCPLCGQWTIILSGLYITFRHTEEFILNAVPVLSLLNKTSLCQKTADVCGVKHIIASSSHSAEDVADAGAVAYILQRQT